MYNHYSHYLHHNYHTHHHRYPILRPPTGYRPCIPRNVLCPQHRLQYRRYAVRPYVQSRSPLKGSGAFSSPSLPSGFTPGGGVGTAWPLDPPLDRQGGTGPGAGARCRRPSEVKGGCSRRMRRIPAPQVPSRHPRGKWVGPQSTPLLGLRSSGRQGIHWEGGPSCAAPAYA